MFRAHSTMTVGEFKSFISPSGLFYSPFHGLLDEHQTLDAYGIDGSFPLDYEAVIDDNANKNIQQVNLNDYPAHEIFLVPVHIHGIGSTAVHSRKKVIIDRKLDGYSLISGCGVDLPEECFKSDLSSPKEPFKDVVIVHLYEFINLSSLNVDDNQLSFEPFGFLPSLEELHIACNRIKTIDFNSYSKELNVNDNLFSGKLTINNQFSSYYYPKLNVLDLSFNMLTQESILSLTQIKTLQDLNLSSNNLKSIPSDLSGFIRLKRLSLRGNLLGDGLGTNEEGYRPIRQYSSINQPRMNEECFLSLNTIPNLQEIDLSDNRLTNVPQLENNMLSKVRFLNISNNQITESSHIISLYKLDSLEWVDVRSNIFLLPYKSRIKSTKETLIESFPDIYKTLVLERHIRIVMFEPSKSKSFLDRDSHILRPPNGLTKRNNYKHDLEHDMNLRLNNTQHLKNMIETREQELELKQQEQQQQIEYKDDNEYNDEGEEEEDKDDTTGSSFFLTSVSDPHEQAKGFDIRPYDEPFIISQLDYIQSHAQVAKATKKLSNILKNPLQVSAFGDNSPAFAQTSKADIKKRYDKKKKNNTNNGKDYNLNRHNSKLGMRKSKVAQVYATMHNVLDAIENDTADSTNLKDYIHARPDTTTSNANISSSSGYYDKKHQSLVAKQRAGRNKRKEETSVQALLSTISVSLK